MDNAEGIALMREVIRTVQANVRLSDKRTSIYFDLIQVLRERGCKMLKACAGEDPAFDDAYDELELRRRT